MKSYRIRGIDNNGKRWYYHALGNYWDRDPLGSEFKFKGDAFRTLYDADHDEPDFLIDIAVVSVDSGYLISVDNDEGEHLYMADSDSIPGFEWIAERKDATWFDRRSSALLSLKYVRNVCDASSTLVRVGC